jgi:hypothetical protein
VNREISRDTHPQPFDTPVGVTSTSANRTSPAANPKRKTPINILSTTRPFHQKTEKNKLILATSHSSSSLEHCSHVRAQLEKKLHKIAQHASAATTSLKKKLS